MIEKTILGLKDIGDLYRLAEFVINELRMTAWQFDDDGNDILRQVLDCEDEEQGKAVFQIRREYFNNRSNNYLFFDENDELKKFDVLDVLKLSLEEIKEKYIKEFLPKARGIMRKDSMRQLCIVSDEIDDEYLDNLLAICWRAELRIWTTYWDYCEKEKM